MDTRPTNAAVEAQRKAVERAHEALKALGVELPGAHGRPTIYSPELVEAICTAIASGTSLRKICKQPGMPDLVTIITWRAKYPEFLKRYEEARKVANEVMREEITEIADDTSNDQIELSDGRIVANSAKLQRDKLRMEAREKSLKLQYMSSPQKIEVSTPEGEAVRVVDVSALRAKAEALARSRRED